MADSIKNDSAHSFCKNIADLLLSWEILDLDWFAGDIAAYKMVLDV